MIKGKHALGWVRISKERNGQEITPDNAAEGEYRLVPTLPPDSVRCIRLALGLSPEELAERIAVTGRTIYAWESSDNTRSCTGPGRLLMLQLASEIKRSQVPEKLEHLWVESDDEDVPFVIDQEGSDRYMAESAVFWADE